MTRTVYSTEIATAARAAKLAPELVEAVVLTESAGRTDAFRFEAGFYARYMQGPEWTWTHGNPRRYSSSYGLMQIMFPVAVEMGFPKESAPELLMIPEVGLEYGCKKLAACLAWASNRSGDWSTEVRLRAALASYNGGRGGNAPDGEPDRNAAYAVKVLGFQSRSPDEGITV